MKKFILLIILLIMISIGFFVVFKPNFIKRLQGIIWQGINPFINNFEQKTKTFIEERKPEVKKEFEKEKQEIRSELFQAGKRLWKEIGEIIKK